ncbi:methyltransferase [Ferrovibrio sp.]|uniref:methyltransferase n=2 Tax=Ferrovibrio sp. TaxID=1917215 RepID=UPI003515FFD7
MNRRQRRAQQKGGGPAARRPAAPAGPRSVSEMLLGLGGVQAVVPVAPPDELQADHVGSALAQLRIGDRQVADLARLQRALAAQPDSETLLFQVARLQVWLDRRADALVTFRRLLAVAPGHAEARHMAAVLAGEPPEKASAEYIASTFDAFADSFDEKLVGWLEYRAPQQLAALARRVLDGRIAERAIDLGCGTGLVGAEVKGLVRRLDGVDLSPRMIGHARRRGVYADLAVEELVALLQRRPDSYDLALAADVLIYIGDLRPLFAALHGALRDGGLFIASVEKGGGARYIAEKSGRYQHGEDYLRRRAEEAGFDLVALEEVVLRKEENRPAAGYVFALRRRPPVAADPLAALSTDDLLAQLAQPAAGLLAAVAQRMIGRDFQVGWALDIGGGMARHAEDLRRLSQHLDMVDPDPARVRVAFESGAFDECEAAGTLDYLEARPDHYDLILAGDALVRAPDAPALFSAVKVALAVAGVFIALADPARQDAATLQAQAQAEGLVVLAVEPVSLPDGRPGLCLIAES